MHTVPTLVACSDAAPPCPTVRAALAVTAGTWRPQSLGGGFFRRFCKRSSRAVVVRTHVFRFRSPFCEQQPEETRGSCCSSWSPFSLRSEFPLLALCSQVDSSLAVECSAFAALSLGLVFVGSCNQEAAEAILTTLLDRATVESRFLSEQKNRFTLLWQMGQRNLALAYPWPHCQFYAHLSKHACYALATGNATAAGLGYHVRRKPRNEAAPGQACCPRAWRCEEALLCFFALWETTGVV